MAVGLRCIHAARGARQPEALPSSRLTQDQNRTTATLEDAPHVQNARTHYHTQSRKKVLVGRLRTHHGYRRGIDMTLCRFCVDVDSITPRMAALLVRPIT